MHLFRLDVREASTVALTGTGDAIAIAWWTPQAGVRSTERR